MMKRNWNDNDKEIIEGVVECYCGDVCLGSCENYRL